jgi:hypothetical protein
LRIRKEKNMSYTKHTWADGELVTAAKMNNIENGIEEASSGGGVLVVTDTDGTLDKTWTEIRNALFIGGAIITYSGSRGGMDSGVSTVIGAYHDAVENKYNCVIGMVGDYVPMYSADSASGYPTAAM